MLAGCGDGSPGPARPRVVDTAAMSPEQLRQAVLDECHGRLQGLSRCSATVTLADGAVVQAFCDLPDKVRAQWPGARMRVLDGGGGFAVTGEEQRPLTADERTRLQMLRTLLDCALLGPLYRATDCERSDGGLRLTTAEGAAWEVQLDQLVPVQLTGSGGTVRILDWLRTTHPWMQTWIPSRASIAALGDCELQWGDENLIWDDSFFAPPQRAAAADKQLVLTPGDDRPRPRPNLRPATPVEKDSPATQWVLLDDPGDWPARTQRFAPYYQELEVQDQQHAGFVGFLREEGRARMIVPFRQRQGGRPFAAPAGWEIRNLPAGRVLEVYPTADDFEQCTAAGTRLLEQALAARKLVADGPIVAQPYLALEDGLPPETKLRQPVVRVSVSVR